MLVSVYIRKADEEKWKALENKTELISKLLNSSQHNTISTPKIINSVEDIQKIIPEAKVLPTKPLPVYTRPEQTL